MCHNHQKSYDLQDSLFLALCILQLWTDVQRYILLLWYYNIFRALKYLLTLPIHPSLLFHPLVITGLFTASIVLPFLECHVYGILQHVKLF